MSDAITFSSTRGNFRTRFLAPISTCLLDVRRPRSCLAVRACATGKSGYDPRQTEKRFEDKQTDQTSEASPRLPRTPFARPDGTADTKPLFVLHRVAIAGAAAIPPVVTGSVTLLGTGSTLTNAHLAVSGNASLSMSVLGRSPTLVWWRPSIADPLMYADGQQPTIGELVPPWVLWVSLQLVLAVLVLAYARGRRLGPVASEPLPVTVRAAEATEGLARLYRRARGRQHAADTLSRATAVRLRTALRLPRGATVAVLAQVVADRAHRPTTEVLALLVPTEPLNDAALVRFADDLDALERQVHHP